MKELLSAIRKNAIGLGLFAIVTAGVIAVTQVATKDRIADNIRAAEARALNQILPQSSYDNDLLNDTLNLNQFDTELLGPISDSGVVWRARMGADTHAVILPVVAPDGYTTQIDMLVGIDSKGNTLGVRVVAHRETPGLGDKIDKRKSDWVDSFIGKSLANTGHEQWAVKKDGGEFDQFTGATITPRAVVSAVHKALEFYENNQAPLLNAPKQEKNDE